LSISATIFALAPPAKIGTAMPGPATGAITANSTKPPASRCRASETWRLVVGEIEFRST
jgi:hypothetical protein